MKWQCNGKIIIRTALMTNSRSIEQVFREDLTLETTREVSVVSLNNRSRYGERIGARAMDEDKTRGFSFTPNIGT